MASERMEREEEEEEEEEDEEEEEEREEGCGSFLCVSVSAAAAPSPVLGSLPPGDGMPVGPVPPGFFQPFMSPRYPGGPRPLRLPNQGIGVPGGQTMLPSGMDPSRQQVPPTVRSHVSMQNYGGGMRPPLNALVGPGMPGMNMGPGGGRPWPNPPNANSSPRAAAAKRSGDIDSLPKNSPGNLSMSNQPGTPREDGEMGGNFLNPFQNESYSPNMTMSV
ncbi:hypothetical protein CRUP_014082 [Coryphaenoides rupestris]|nr:hypothetical protein CRUP_014082 [Coryphaenoides rupestris]